MLPIKGSSTAAFLGKMGSPAWGKCGSRKIRGELEQIAGGLEKQAALGTEWFLNEPCQT